MQELHQFNVVGIQFDDAVVTGAVATAAAAEDDEYLQWQSALVLLRALVRQQNSTGDSSWLRLFMNVLRDAATPTNRVLAWLQRFCDRYMLELALGPERIEKLSALCDAVSTIIRYLRYIMMGD